MILQALYEYYQRKADDPESKIAPPGFEWNNKLQFFIVIDEHGKFVQIEPNEVPYLLPRAVKRSGANFLPNILWDKEEYILGTFYEDQSKHNLFKKLIFEDLPEIIREDKNIKAIINFYSNNELESIKHSPDWEKIKKAKNPNMTFKMVGKTEPVACCDVIMDYIKSTKLKLESDSDDDFAINNPKSLIKGICSITGEKTTIARTHQKTFINKDANLLVSFQKNSGYDSYGKEQGYNASIGVPAEFAYTTALKMLLEGSRNKFHIKGTKKAGTTIIFWAEKQTALEDNFSFFFTNLAIKDETDKDVLSIKATLESIYSGKLNDEGKTKFFILGLCQGGGSRIAIRFWKPGTVKQVSDSIAIHFSDLSIIQSKQEEKEYFTLYSLLRSIVLKGELDNLPPNLPGTIIEAILDEHKFYPATLQQQCIRRIRAEQHVNHIRAAILKAYLNRKGRIYNINEKQITMALDFENTNQGYLCGRLFAVLEKVQEEAQPGINATIKDRFYGAASSTPVTVFGRLLSLTNHHLTKLHPGRKTNLEKLINEVMASVSSKGMPAHLSLDDQSRFAIGYYHQRQDLFTKKENND